MIYNEEETPYENLKRTIIGLKRFVGTENTINNINTKIYEKVKEGEEEKLTKEQVLEIMNTTSLKGEKIVFVNKVDTNIC